MYLSIDPLDLAAALHERKPTRELGPDGPTGAYRQWLEDYLTIEYFFAGAFLSFDRVAFINVAFNGRKD